MKKRLLAILLCASMAASLLTVGAMADDETEQVTPASGTCGDNLTWELDESGTLTISGTGDMWDYNHYGTETNPANPAPWVTKGQWSWENNTITKVVIGEGVTRVGNEAFQYCNVIYEIDFPSTLKSIGDEAFVGNQVNELNLPAGLESIGNYAFELSWNLESVTLPDGLKSIGYGAFGAAVVLKKAIIPESVTEIGLGAFGTLKTAGPIGSGCELEFGWTTSIPDNAFGGSGADNGQYSSFTSITLPNTITSIGDEAFRASQDLKHIKIPDSVKSIGDSAFWWSGIESVELPDGLESLGSGAFYNCEYLQSIDLPDSLSRIEKYTFAYCPSLESVTIPESITYIGQNAFSDTEWDEGSKSIYFEGDAPVCTDSGETGSFPSDATLYYLDGTDGWIDSEYYAPDTGLWRGYRLSIKIGGIPPVVSTTPVITLDKSYIEEGETATLTWNPVDSAVEYVVNIRKVGSEDGIQTYKKTSECKCEFSGLTEGTYYISVYAKDEHGNGSDLSNIVALVVSNKMAFVRNLTNDVLTYASKEERDSIQNSLYNIMFVAEFRPDTNTFSDEDYFGTYGNEPTSMIQNKSKKYGETTWTNITQKNLTGTNWPIRNRRPRASSVYDGALGRVTFNYLTSNGAGKELNSAVGCMSYAYFVSSYVYGSTGYGHRIRLSTKTEAGLEQLLTEYADPGEQIRIENDIHSLIYLGSAENSDGRKGFYYMDYGDNGGTDPTISVGFVSYREFLNKYKSNTILIFDTNNGSYATCTASGEATAGDLGDLRTKMGIDRTVIRLECPVEAVITLAGESLDSREADDGETIKASFGSVTRTGDSLLFDLSYDMNYQFIINGTGNGDMTLTLEYYDGSTMVDRRIFSKVPITSTTTITTSSFNEYSYDSYLLDVYDSAIGNNEIWSAGPNSTTYSPDEESNNTSDASMEGLDDDAAVSPTPPIIPSNDIYAITVLKPDHGTIDTSLSNASAGAVIEVTAEPDEGYELAYITVDGERVSGTSFKMPGHDVEVSAAFVREGAALPFTDVAASAWYYDAVSYVYANGLMDGVSALSFNPDGAMTRAMVWAILARIDGETVTGADWAAEAREWAVAAGVSDGTDPDGYVTREQLVTMLYCYAGEPAASGSLSGWADAARVSDWAEGAMAWAVGEGVITGASATELNPAGSATRAECAAILMRYVEL